MSNQIIHALILPFVILFVTLMIFSPSSEQILGPQRACHPILANSHLERRKTLSVGETADWWDRCIQRPLSAPSVQTGEVKILSLSSSTSITYSTLSLSTGATERGMNTINEAICCGLSSAAHTAFATDVCTLDGFPLHPENAAHVISVEERLQDKQFLLPFRRSLFFCICFKMTQSAHSGEPLQDSQNWWGRNSPILQQSQECMS